MKLEDITANIMKNNNNTQIKSGVKICEFLALYSQRKIAPEYLVIINHHQNNKFLENTLSSK